MGVKQGREDRSETKLALYLILSIIPAGLAGYFGETWIESQVRSSTIIALGLIGWGIVLYLADQYHRRLVATGAPLTDIDHLSAKQVAVVALAQAIALIPGTSRSGITMTAGLFSKIEKTSAAELSFLMSVPIIAIAGAKKIVDLFSIGLGDLSLTALTTGFVAAAIAGFFAIWGLMKIIQRWSFTPFVVYRITIGLLILWLL